MATTWTHGAWRRETGTAAQRDKLILHIEEIEAYLAAYSTQSDGNQSGSRFDLEQYLTRLNARLERFDLALGLTPEADDPVFIQAQPRI